MNNGEDQLVGMEQLCYMMDMLLGVIIAIPVVEQNLYDEVKGQKKVCSNVSLIPEYLLAVSSLNSAYNRD